ncbi:LamG-like jellyroll fold domain-containing protein [Nocardioides renjunii]|uniref:LamG-like jellyroll fold domain-containing protein n=1 Tax=Nocardioides renjunii TaxID=3095075 RepID=UPI002AFF4037|nr:LamG-like jellyroll fold domain-containing protein [Nocardioides sp. S-34]WQQ23555.1 LamG-like jellyroll fold domain-containing protein [Nocardioides sp. S-34]
MNLLHRSARRRPTRRLRRAATRVVALTAALGVALPLATLAAAPATAVTASAAPGDDDVLRVLLFSSGDGVHGSVANTRAAVKEMANSLAAQYGLDGNTGDASKAVAEVQETTNAAVFTPENLGTKDLLVFAHTAGVLFNTDQRAALEGYIRGGGGFAGIHYTSWSPDQTEHDVNPFYRRLVGAASTGHPEPAGGQRGTVTVTDGAHPLTAGISSPLSYTDEWYEWDVNPTQNVRTLVTVDESTYAPGARIGEEGTSHPVTWCQSIDQGRSWYSSLGHHASAWTAADDGGNANDNQADDFVRAQLRNGMAYSAGLLPADCSPPKKDEQGEMSAVTPWPLMPINAALTSDGKVQSFGSVGSGCTDNTPYDYSGNDCVTQGGQMEIDVWDPTVVRTVANLVSGVVPNATYTDLFCSMQVQMPHRRSTFTVGGDDGLGGNAPNDAAIGVTSYSTGKGLKNEAPMNFPRWYPTGTTLPNGSIVAQGGSLRGGPGGPGVLTPEVYDPQQGSSWKLLTGATSAQAYGDGADAPQDENRWWYPRAFVAPTNGNVFTITGTQMFELDPSGDGAVTMRGTLGNGTGNQGALGNPVGATSTATMYRPGKILQVGGGWWANGGGPAGARAGFTVDISGGTAAPVVTATDPMKHRRHWATSTVMPDGRVLVTGGSRDNNGQGGYVTNPEIWNPDAPSGQQWTEVEIPYEHARLYHSVALLLPDGRIMIGGGGAPGPHNYTDVEYYSPAYLFDGDEPAVRPVVTNAPRKIGYDGTFSLSSDKPVERVTLVRNGSVTHGFNNDQNFQDLSFTQSGGTVSVTSPTNANFAPPGAYMVFVWSGGVPSVAKIVQIDPTVKMAAPAPTVVDQFEYPRLPASWRSGTYDSVQVAAGNGRMSPWVVDDQVQLIRANAGGMGALGLTGYHLAVGADGELTRTLKGLSVGKQYRLSVRYARDSRSAGTAPGTAALSIADLTTTLSASTQKSSNAAFDTFVGTFTATARQQDLTISGGGPGGSVVLDDLVVVGTGLGVDDAVVQYAFEEGTGSTAANTGSDNTVGAATLTGTTGWSTDGVTGGALDLPGGTNANTVDLPDNLLQGETDFTTSFWVRPDTKGNWINLFHIGDGLGDAGSFFQVQMQTQANGNTGLAATFKKKGSNVQERVFAVPTKDVAAGRWNHVVFTRQGATGTLYLDGQKIASRNDLTITMTDVGPTTNNWLGRNGYPDPAFDGRMDDVRLWTTALTDADVAGLHADGTAVDTTTTVTTSPASPSAFNTPITVSATVKDEANANPTGVAELWIDGTSQGGQVAVTNGQVVFPEVTLAPRQHDIEVRFIAAAGWRDSVGTTQHTVARPPVGEGVPVRYTFDEGTGTSAANSGSDPAIGAGVLQGNAGWTAAGKYGSALNLPGQGHVRLPNDITEGMEEEITISTWIRPTALPNWTSHVQIGKGQDEFLLVQSEWDSGARGFVVTLRNNNGEQYRTALPGTQDLPLGQWTHVAVTMGPAASGTGSTVKIYFDGVLRAENTVPVMIGDITEGGTNANFIGNGSWPDPRPTEQQDDFRIYGYALSAEDVLAIFNGTTNVAPVGVPDAYTTTEGQVLEVSAEDGVLANDTDAEGDDLTAGDVSGAAGGVVTVDADGSFSYVPDEGFSGADTFTYKASDGTATSQATTVTVTVEEVAETPNRAPVGVDDAFATVAGEPLTLAAPGVLGNDTDADGDALTATRTSQPVNGSVTVNANGSFTYTPDAGFAGRDVFTYTAGDGTDTSAPATVTITVRPTGGNGGGPLTSAVAGASTPITYGQAGTIVASVAPSGATGRVEAVDGTTVLASGVLASGQARLALPARSLLPGTHRLTLRYVGDDGHRASSSSMEVTVAKVVPRMTVKAPSTVKKGKAAKVTVVLTAADDVPVTGTVSVAVRGGRTVTGTLRDGRVVIRLPKATRTWRLTVTYGGSALAEPVSDKVTIKVRRKK